MNIFICIFLSVCLDGRHRLDFKSTYLLKSIDDFEAISGYVQSHRFMGRSVAGPLMEKPASTYISAKLKKHTGLHTIQCSFQLK